MRNLALMMMAGWLNLLGQEVLTDHIAGFRLNGRDDAKIPVAGQDGDPISVEFDWKGDLPRDFKVRAIHCDRDWKPTETSFINNRMDNRVTVPLPYDLAPPGVRGYRFQYRFRIPGIAGLERFAYSGNYLLEILDEEENEVLVREKFYVAEHLVRPVMKIVNRRLASEVHPLNQVHRVEIGIVVPEFGPDRERQLLATSLTGVDIVRNRQLDHPWRIDALTVTPMTFVEGWGTSRLKFIIENIRPGNEYRRLDLRNVTLYPAGVPLRPRDGADVSRYLQASPRDNNGTSVLTTGSRDAEYLPFRFELAMDVPLSEAVYVVGDFNGWRHSPAYQLRYDDETKRYTAVVYLRRGMYDYQYIVGTDDWTSLEGNDWRTVSVYSAFVYYRDPRFGGFDRIVGFIQGSGPGGSEATY